MLTRMSASTKQPVKARDVNCDPCRVRTVRLNMFPYQVSLNFPPNRTYTVKRIRLSGFLLAFAKYCQQYVWILHYVRLSYCLQSENLLAFAL